MSDNKVPIRKVKVMLDLEFVDSKFVPLDDVLEYVRYRLNLGVGKARLIDIKDVCVLQDVVVNDDSN